MNYNGNYIGCEKNIIDQIKDVKEMYDQQVKIVEREEHIKKLLFEDFVRTVKKNKTRYSYINIFKVAQDELKNKYKKDRKNIEVLNKFILEDFLNNDKNFKLKNIISCGLETYGWDIEYEGYGKTFRIGIPVLDAIDSKNIKFANYGAFEFVIMISESHWSVLKRSYSIEELSKFIDEYFEKIKDGERNG